MQSVTIGKNQAGQRLDKYLHKYMPAAGTGFLYKMLRRKNITLNGKKADGSEILKPGDEVVFFFSEETFAKFRGTVHAAEYEQAYGQLQGIQVIYEDENVLALSKPAGVLSQKTVPSDISLNEWLVGRLLERDAFSLQDLETFRPSVCNRLDRNTSGLVLCGSSLAGSQYLSQCIRERSIRKFYLTVCVGKLEREAEIGGFLVKDKKRNQVTVRREQDADGTGEAIRTAYRPLQCKDDYTLLEVELITGKPHQIRAHLAGLGHPLIGDRKYGDEHINRLLEKRFGLQYQLLHAARVVFPACDEGVGASLSRRTITAPCPKEFERIQAGLGFQ